MEKIKVTTASGCLVEVDPGIADDWEVLELLAESDDNPAAVVKLTRKTLGEAQYKAVKDSLKARDGRVKASAMADELQSLFDGVGALKNS